MPDRRCCRLILTFLLVAFTTCVAEAGPLPRLAVSLPAQVRTSDVQHALQSLEAKDALIVLAPVAARFGTDQAAADAIPVVDELLAPGAQVYARLTIGVGALPSAGRERETLIERQATEIVARLGLDRPGVAGLVIEPSDEKAPEDVVQFVLATLAIKAKAVKSGLRVVLALGAANALTSGGQSMARLAAYADAVVLSSREPSEAAAGRPIVLRAVAGSDPGAAASAFLDVLMSTGAAAAETIWIEVPTLSALNDLCGSVRFLSRSLGEGLEMTAADRAPIEVRVDGRRAAPAIAFVGGRTADVAVLFRTGATAAAPQPVSLVAPTNLAPQVSCHSALDGRVLAPAPVAPPGGPTTQACRADTDYVLLVARSGTPADRVFQEVRVTGTAGIRVEEIIARWQASREAERRDLRHYTVPCLLALHFESTSIDLSLDVAMEMQQFVDRDGGEEWVQTGLLVNGVRLGKGREFPLPQLEPEKVVTRPLELRIDEKYDYELLGTDNVDGHICYVVSIRPTRAGESLYSGKAWIDGTTFRQVRLRLEQRDGKNNIASHVETQNFEQVADNERRAFTLLRSIDAEDAVNLAGRTVTVEKRYRFGQYALNAPDFAERLTAFHASDAKMFRETDAGLRTLGKKGNERVVEPVGGKRIRALVTGVLYNGMASFPVPLAGLTWVDFDFRKTGMQLSALFAGPIFSASLSRQESKSLRWGVDMSLDAIPYTYYVYQGNQELTGQQISNFEQDAGALLNWQVTPELVLSGQGRVYFDVYRQTGDTDPLYRAPASGFRLEAYGEAKYVRRGFSGLATVTQTRRLGWRDFGFADRPAPTAASYTLYSFEISQHLYAGKLTRGGVSASYYGGRNLDRFSRYSPNFLLPPRLKGIPVGVDSFDSITTLGAYYGFNVMDLAKLEGSYGHSWTRNAEEGNAVRQFDGVDVNLGLAGPFGTFVQGTFSFAIRGNLERYQSRWGTYLLFLRPLKR